MNLMPKTPILPLVIYYLIYYCMVYCPTIIEAAMSSATLSPFVSRMISMAKGNVVPGPSEVIRFGAITTFSLT